jgi:hypothetical protein
MQHDISSVIEELWSLFTDFFYLVLQKWDEIIIFHPDDGINVSLLDFSVTALVLGVVLSVVLGIRYSIPAQNDLH